MEFLKNKSAIAALKAIADKDDGVLYPRSVVAAARSKTSVLHRYFTWDNSEAAEKWRLREARDLIRVSVEILPHTETMTKVFVSLSSDRQSEDGGYRALVSVLSDKDYRQQLIQDAIADMQIFRDKYKSLRELAVVFEAMDKVKAG